MYVFGSGWRGWRGGEWMRGLCLGFTNPVGTGGVLGVCLCFVADPGICILCLADTCAS